MVPLVQLVVRQTGARIFRGNTHAEGKILNVFGPRLKSELIALIAAQAAEIAALKAQDRAVMTGFLAVRAPLGGPRRRRQGRWTEVRAARIPAIEVMTAAMAMAGNSQTMTLDQKGPNARRTRSDG
jgi:hypothetical protein